MAVFSEISFGQAVERASTQDMTAENITELDSMIFNQLAGDDELVRIVSGQGYTDDVTGGNLSGVSLEKVLQARVDQLLQQARYGMLSEGDQYTLDFYRELLKNPRYTGLIISNAVNYSSTGVSDTNGNAYTSYIQMAAFQLPDGTVVPSFAGTGAEIDSWVEDGRMATTDQGVDAQKAAADYLQWLMELHPEAQFILNGYSKGGNAALYAAIRCLDIGRITRIFNFDGPGFGDKLLNDPEFAQKYKELQLYLGDKLYYLSPENSLVGHLMNDHPYYIYLDTDGFVFVDHDYTTWKWLPDGSISRVETRTELSLQVEQIMEDLLANFNDAEMDRFYDMLSELALRYDIHTVSDLEKLGLGEDGEFSLSVLVQNIISFWKDQSLQDQELLKDIVSRLVTMDNLSMLLSSILSDWINKTGHENPLGSWLTSQLLENLLRQLTVVLVIVGAVYTATMCCVEIVKKIGSLLGEALQKLYLAMDAAIQKVGEIAGEFFEQCKKWLIEFVENFSLHDVVDSVGDMILKGAQKLKEGASALGRWAQDTFSELWTSLRQGMTKENIQNFFEKVTDCGKQLVTNAFVKVRGILFQWSASWSGPVTLRIDSQQLDQARRTAQAAANLSWNLAPRLRSLMSRLAREGIRNPENILCTFADMYNLTVASIVVDFHDDIDGMTGRIAQVEQEHDSLKNTLRRQISNLSG